ncbi:Nn.00g096330.m01.CDS01 [Neocucurbitaria sp. VM-36]
MPSLRLLLLLPLRRLFYSFTQHWRLAASLTLLMLLETLIHIHTFSIPRPPSNLDPPFSTGCQTPVLNTTARENATFMMLARNSDVAGAVSSVKSVQAQFNMHFGYPWVFLNDEEWSAEFKEKVGKAVGEGVKVVFETIPREMWGFPSWIDREKARRRMREMQRAGVIFFYDHPSLLPYKFYWRVEPSIRFTCAIPYDPFTHMAQHRKKYAFAIALWEHGTTAPSLFRKISDFKARMRIPTAPLWTAMTAPSYAPWPFRYVLALLRNRDAKGDLWNMCHFWSNFEIADMDFFRSDAYRALFKYLDEDGGFYYERWGDAAVHSLGVGMLLRPEEVHFFGDWGYVHGGLQYCPAGRREGDRAELGCRCKCGGEGDGGAREVEPVCLNRIRRTVE